MEGYACRPMDQLDWCGSTQINFFVKLEFSRQHWTWWINENENGWLKLIGLSWSEITRPYIDEKVLSTKHIDWLNWSTPHFRAFIHRADWTDWTFRILLCRLVCRPKRVISIIAWKETWCIWISSHSKCFGHRLVKFSYTYLSSPYVHKVSVPTRHMTLTGCYN